MFTPPGVDMDAYARALVHPYQSSTRLSLLTLEFDPVAEVDRVKLSGQTTWTGRDAQVSRTAQVDLLDPGYELDLDSESPDDGAVYPNRLLRIEHITTSPLLAAPVLVPVFTGPLVMYRRDGDVLGVEAQGMEMRLRTDVAPIRCGKNMRVVDAIERIARRCGIRMFAFPTGVRDKLPKDIVAGREEDTWPWPVMVRLARSIGMQLFFNGLGVLVLRDIPEQPVFEFTRPTSYIKRDHDWSTVYNRVEVTGRKKVKVALSLDQVDPTHPFAPSNMAAHGRPWERTFFYTDDKIGTKAQARKVARRELGRVTRQNLGVEFNHPAVWHLDPLDPCRVNGEVMEFVKGAASLGSGEMTVGYTANVKRPAA